MQRNTELHKLEKYLWEQKLSEENWFVFNLLNFNYMFTDSPFSLLNLDRIDHSTLDDLMELGFVNNRLEDIIFNEKRNEWIEFIRKEYNSKLSEILIRIVPTFGCNFRCSYCYQPPLFQEETRDDNSYMNEKQTLNLLSIIENKIDFSNQKLALMIAGGEALLNDQRAFDFIKRISDFACKHDSSLIFVTNGYEVHRFLPFLHNCNSVRFNITVDGIKEIHNKRRYLENKKGSFDKIIFNIDKMLKETKHSVQIRINIDDKNIKFLPELFDYLNNKGWINHEKTSIAIRVTVKYETSSSSDVPIGKCLLSYSYFPSIISLILKYRAENCSIDGLILPHVLSEVFMAKLRGLNIDKYDWKNIDLVCSANQGIFGYADHKGLVKSCGFEVAPEWGKYFPILDIEEDKTEEWNSTEFILDKFNKNPCIDCKLFFVCSVRQCPFSTYELYDEGEKICIDKKQIITGFFKNFNHMF